MKKHIWINPVAAEKYKKIISKIHRNLIDKGYTIVECKSQAEYIRNEYKKYSINRNSTILDCRCPKTIEILNHNNLINKNMDIPSIDPILISTSKFLYDKYINDNESLLIITCPCTHIRDFGRKIFKDNQNIVFYTWKEFAERENLNFHGEIKKSPIPLGFFKNEFNDILEISGESEILKEIKKINNSNEIKYSLVEMLYCKDGCNNGDGI